MGLNYPPESAKTPPDPLLDTFYPKTDILIRGQGFSSLCSEQRKFATSPWHDLLSATAYPCPTEPDDDPQ